MSTSKITRQEFCERMLVFLGCMLAPDAPFASDNTQVAENADELLYFLRKIPTEGEIGVCFVGAFSSNLIRKCFVALGDNCVRSMLARRKVFILGESEFVKRSLRELDMTIGENISSSVRVCDFNEFPEEGRILTIIFDVGNKCYVHDEVLQHAFKSSAATIAVVDSNRAIKCEFLPDESRNWCGTVMTVGSRAVVLTRKDGVSNDYC